LLIVSFCRIITIIGYHHRWLLLSSSTDRRVRKISLSQVSGKYVLVYCFFVIKAKILPCRDTDERLQVLPNQAVVHDTLQSGFAGTTICSPS